MIIASKRTFVIGWIALNSVMLGWAWWDIDQSRRHYEEQAVAATQSVAGLVAENLVQSTRAIDLTLMAISDELTRQAKQGSVDSAAMKELLQSHARWVPEVYAIRVTDKGGKVLWGTDYDPGKHIDWSDRDFFVALRDRPDMGLHVGKAIQGRITKGWLVPFSRSYFAADGSFAGAVVISFHLDQLQQILVKTNVGPHGIALLRDADTALIARYPSSEVASAQLGAKKYSPELAALMAGDAPEGTFHTQATGDGHERTNTYRRLALPPFHLVVGLGSEDYLQGWRTHRLKSLSAAAFFMLVSFGAGLLLWRSSLRANREGQRSKALLRNASDGIYIVDTGGCVVEASDSFCQMLGYDRQEIIGRHFSLWETDSSRGDALAAEANYETSHRRKDGRLLQVEVRGHMVDIDGAPVVFNSARDITARKEAESRLAALMDEQKAILHSQVAGIVMLRHRRMVWMNEAFADMFGYAVDELVNQSTRLFYPDDKAFDDFLAAAYPAVAAGTIYRTQMRFHRKNGEPGWFDISGGQLNRSSDESIWAFVDITVLKETEIALDKARLDAEAANRAKSQFLATMSHEIRTPMNGILGMAQMLLLPGITEAERVDYARTILNSGQTLLTLLNDILDLSKVEAGKLELHDGIYDPAQLIHEVDALFAEAARNKGLAITGRWSGSEARRYRGDSHRLRQMLANFVSNAIKFTERGGIRIEASEIEAGNGSALLEFAVADTGSGIPQDKLERLFKPFSQVDSSTTRQFGGTGLGLSIVKSLARLMGGEVGVSSESGRGSRFWFRIPARLDATSGENRETPRPTLSELAAGAIDPPVRILVAEDNEVNRKVITALLKKLNADVELTEHGALAVEAIKRGARPDLILMDIQMPVMDGYAATAAIRAWERERNIPRLPIVALTADAFAEDQERCLAAGMDDFLAKPVRLEGLHTVLRQWCGTAPGTPAPAEP